MTHALGGESSQHGVKVAGLCTKGERLIQVDIKMGWDVAVLQKGEQGRLQQRLGAVVISNMAVLKLLAWKLRNKGHNWNFASLLTQRGNISLVTML